ncbi:MAG: hypothetical protein JWM27_4737 [Gemmatimonadetes bacterium]|nr:hypothetical protein [Gemmatimonadota bacterium]
MPVLSELIVKLDTDLSGLDRGMTAAQRSANQLADKMADLGKTLSLGVTLPIVAFGASCVKAAADVDSLSRGMAAVTGSAEAAAKEMTALREVAKLPGLGFREAVSGSIALQAAGFSALTARRALLEFGNALATVGKGKAELDRVTLALSQMASKGKISAEELNQLAESVPQIRVVMKDAFGTADTEKLQKSGVTVQQWVDRVLDSLGKLKRVSGGVGNEFENLSDTFFQLRVTIGQQLLPAVVPLLSGLSALLEKAGSVSPEALRMGIAFGVVAAAIPPLIFVAGSLTTAITAISTALSIGILPLLVVGGPLLIGLGLLAVAFVKSGMDALAAAANAEAAAARFRAALAGMDQATLVATAASKLKTQEDAAIALKLVNEQLTAARRKVDEFNAAWDRTVRNPNLQGPGVTAASRAAQSEVDRLAAQQSAMQEVFNRASTEAQAAADQFNANRTAAVKAPAPPLGGAGKDMHTTLDRINEELARANTLATFGLGPSGVLPEGIAETASRAEDLRGKIASLAEDLKKLGARAPAGARSLLAQFRDEAEQANKELREMADRLARIAGTHVNTTIQQSVTNAPSPLTTPLTSPVGAGSILGNFNPTPLQVALTTLGYAASAAAGSLREFGAGQLQNAMAGVEGFVAQLTPAGLAAVAIAAALDALRPAMTAVLAPVRIFGEIIALGLVPVLRFLFPILKAVAIAASYVQEVFDRVAGGIATALGALIKGLGKLINKLPGSPGDPLVKAGNALLDLGKGLKDAAGEIAKKREELKHLTFDDALNDATNGLNKFTEALSNVPPLFDLALRRIEAGRLGGPVPATPSTPSPTPTGGGVSTPAGGGNGGGRGGGTGVTVVIEDGAIRGGGNAREVAAEVVRLLADRLGATGDADARSLGLTLRLAGA